MNSLSVKKELRCPACKKMTSARFTFCQYCRYPIKVKKLGTFTKDELVLQLQNLFTAVKGGTQARPRERERDTVYDELMSLHWLRPESALVNFIEIEKLLRFKKNYLTYPMLDLGCGEGFYTSVLFGAKIRKTYDAYGAVDLSKTDPYNTYAEIPRDFFIRKPSRIGYGVDIKESAVQKARDLNIYDDVKQGDLRALPFEANSMRSVFSNMIDDVGHSDLPTVFSEIHRVLRGDGHVVFRTPNERFRKFLFYHTQAETAKKKGDKDAYALLTMLDRGRSEWEPRPLSLWKKLFKETSFQLVDHVDYIDKRTLQFWDTGFRPFFSSLLEVRNVFRKNDVLLPIKEVWVEVLKKWLSDYSGNSTTREGAFSIIVAKKING